mgnify:CR=1 FL=1
MEQQIARIALSGVPYSADKLYSYLVPPELADACRAGVRVSVPFGRGNRRTEGFVLETLCEAADKPLKPVFTVLDKQPLLDTSLLRLAKWMKALFLHGLRRAQDHSARGHLVPLPRDLPPGGRCTGERLVSTCRGEPNG